MAKRRVRSTMSMQEAHMVMAEFAKNTVRFVESSDLAVFSGDNEGKTCFSFLVDGRPFTGSNDNVFEAIRVLGGHKLPKKP